MKIISTKSFARPILFVLILIITHMFSISRLIAEVSPQQAFHDKLYQQFLGSSGETLKQAVANPSDSYLTLLMVTIAIDKTNGWDTVAGNNAHDTIAASPEALRYVDATSTLLHGDVRAVDKLFQGTPPSFVDWAAAIPILREHDYPLASNIFTAVLMTGNIAFGRVNPTVIQDGVNAWLSIPKAQRTPLDRLMLDRFTTNPSRAVEVARFAFNRYLHPPKQTESPLFDEHAYFELAMLVGQEYGLLTLDNAEQLVEAGYSADAAIFVQKISNAHPSDVNLQAKVISFLRFRVKDNSAVLARYLQELKSAPEPYGHSIRMGFGDFYQALCKSNNTELLNAMPKFTDPLITGDCLLWSEAYPDATRYYLQQYNAMDASFGRRLEAWCGLLDSDPVIAFQYADAMLDELQKQQEPERTKLTEWLGWNVWRVAQAGIPGSYHDWHNPITTYPGWETQIAHIMARIEQIDIVSCIHYNPDQRYYSLRYPMALIFTLAHQYQQASDILRRQVVEQTLPPAGGIRDPLGRVLPGTENTPITITYPQDDETERLTKDLFKAIGYCYRKNEVMPWLCNQLIQDTVVSIASKKEVSAQYSSIEIIALSIDEGFAALNPVTVNPSTDQYQQKATIDKAQFSALSATIRNALKDKIVAKNSLTLLDLGLMPVFFTTTNSEEIDGLFSLITDTIDCDIVANHNSKVVAFKVKAYITQLQTCTAYDMKPYAKRLQEKYLTAGQQ